MTWDAKRRAPGVDAPAAGPPADVPRTMPSLGRRRSVLGIAWVVVAALGVGGGDLSLALFNHTVPVAEPFSAGTIVLDVTPNGTLVTLSAMVPPGS